MSTVPHEFVTVDMRPLKSALVAHARAQRVSVSVVVRDAVARALRSRAEGVAVESSRPVTGVVQSPETIQLAIRLTRGELVRLDAGASTAGMSRNAFVAGLIEGVSVLSSGGRIEHVEALISSSSEIATLARNLRHLADLLRRGESRAAQEYRDMLKGLSGDIKRHLHLAGEVLARLRPARDSTAGNLHSERRKEEF